MSASVFRKRLPWYRALMRTPSGVLRGYPVAYMPHTPAYTEKCKPCLLCGMFGARSSSDTDHNISRKECVTVVDAWGSRWRRERCSGWWYRVMRCNSFSRTSRGDWGSTGSLGWAWSHGLETPATRRSKLHPFNIAKATIFCLCLIISSTLRATRAPSGSRAGPPSNLGVELTADTSTFEYERHGVCLSVKASNDEPSHVPLHARTLRGVALSSWWSSFWSLSAQAARGSFRGLMEALNWYWRCTACNFFVFTFAEKLIGGYDQAGLV